MALELDHLAYGRVKHKFFFFYFSRSFGCFDRVLFTVKLKDVLFVCLFCVYIQITITCFNKILVGSDVQMVRFIIFLHVQRSQNFGEKEMKNRKKRSFLSIFVFVIGFCFLKLFCREKDDLLFALLLGDH